MIVDIVQESSVWYELTYGSESVDGVNPMLVLAIELLRQKLCRENLASFTPAGLA